MSTYVDRFRELAAGTVTPLHANVQRLEKELASIRQRAADAKEDVASTETALAELKGLAGEHLTGDRGSADRFATSLRKLGVRLATAREIDRTFATEITSAKERELSAARLKLRQALMALYGQVGVEAESAMTKQMDTVVAEHDAFLAAARQTFADHAVGLDGFALNTPPPKAAHVRIASIERFLTRPPLLVLTPPPARPVVPVPPPQAKPVPQSMETPIEPVETLRETQEPIPAAPEPAPAPPEPEPTPDRPAPAHSVRHTLLTGDVGAAEPPQEAPGSATAGPEPEPAPITPEPPKQPTGAETDAPQCPTSDDPQPG